MEVFVSKDAVITGLAGIAKAKARSDAQKSMMGRAIFFVEQLESITLTTDLKRIQAFCDKFELTEDELFSLLGTAVCLMAVITINAGKDDSLFADMDDYIMNELLNSGYIQED